MGISERDYMRKGRDWEQRLRDLRKRKRVRRIALPIVLLIALLLMYSVSQLSWAASEDPPDGSKQDKALFNTAEPTIVKRSRNNICHVPGSPSYSQTREFRAYRTLQDCLDSGGRRPGASGSIVNINTASAAELESLRGIGPVLAQRIIQGRPYASAEDIRRVQGIGPSLVESLRPFLRTEGETEGR